MKRAQDKRLRQPATVTSLPGSQARARQIGSGDATSARDPSSARGFLRLAAVAHTALGLLVAGSFWATSLAMWFAARVYFRRLVAVGLEGFPNRGPVLLLSNHPAAWTDALVLDVVLRRKFRFITYERLFHPWLRGLFLRLFGSLPVRFASEDAAAEINRRTFDRCHQVLARGGAVGFFPEGVSGGDRSLLPLKSGAARLLLERVASGEAVPPVIPVAIYYEDRTAFRAGVVVAVRPSIPLAPALGPDGDVVAAAHALTGSLAASLESALDIAIAGASKLDDPRPLALPKWARWIASPFTSLAAAAGVILHLVPILTTESVVRSRALPPQQVALARISLGTIVLVVWYLLLALVMIPRLGLPWYSWLAAPILAAASCHEYDRRRARRIASAKIKQGGAS